MKLKVSFIDHEAERERQHFRNVTLAALMAIIMLGIVLFVVGLASAQTPQPAYTASWYSVESCRREGTSGIMANGKELNDEAFTCASWAYPLNSILKVTNLENEKTVIVKVTDRGPAKRLVKKGRILDLSKRAFAQIAPLKQGIIPISIEVLQ